MDNRSLKLLLAFETNTDTRGLTFSHGDSLSLSEDSANNNVVKKLRDDVADDSDPCMRHQQMCARGESSTFYKN